ncbi:SCO family protein [Marinicella gelatinilytica]|uniref:SCO family protein n=1 Tax=Marinicella gelatinilytica TaxID=2996017 RepID=UPI002260898F|nr:SCO family protein [Marinicella gelatinilytica]MCX7546041.1 SCO family protein [Marinicella gelatinilytica]
MRIYLALCMFLILAACQSDDNENLANKDFQALKVFPQPLLLDDIQLISKTGNTVSIDDLTGQYSVVFFGFTHCPDICPTTLLDMQKINKKLQDSGHTPPQFVFISVDPERDKPNTLKDYIAYFNPDFKAYTADDDNLKKLASQLGVAYQVEDHEPGDMSYQVDHTAAWFVLNEDAQRVGIFTTPHEVETITADLELLEL